MRLISVRLILLNITLVALGSVTASAQSPDAKARAREILNQARTALGGEAALAAVRSLSGSGDFRSGATGNEVSGEFQMDLLLPNKLIRTMKWSPTQTMKATRVEALDEDQVWTNAQAKRPEPILDSASTGIGGMGRGGGRRRSKGGGASCGKQPDSNEPVPELPEQNMDNQQIRSDFSCLITALLLPSQALSQAEFSYTSEGDIDGAKADFLKVVIGRGLEISLALDQKTHRPMMVAYKSSMAETHRRGRPRIINKDGIEQSLEPEITEVQIYFSEYKAIAVKGYNDIWLPCQITKTRNGQTVEDMHIQKFQINPHLKPKQFEKKG